MTDQVQNVRINLVEQVEWKPWDPGEQLMVHASDAAYDAFEVLKEKEAEDWLSDIIGKERRGVHDWSPRSHTFSDDERELLVKALQERELEHTSQMVTDAMTWMYEEAAMPSDRDIEGALEAATHGFRNTDVFYEGDEELWAPLLDAGWTSEKIADGLMDAAAYDREPNHYDRYLDFKFQDAAPVRELLKKGGGGVPISTLNSYLRNIAGEVENHFWRYLNNAMDRIDIENRSNWRKHWQSMLEDKRAIKGAHEEMVEYLNERGDLTENQARLIAKTILALASPEKTLTAEAAAELHGPEFPDRHHAQSLQEAGELLGFSKAQIDRHLGGRKRRGR